MRLRSPLDHLFGAPPVEKACSARTKVWWSRKVLDLFLRDAERWLPRETGAALLGFRSDSAVVVRDLVFGGPRAKHRRGGFVPDGRSQTREIATRYAASGRLDTFLGDVHSHPEGGLQLSHRDRRTARRTAEHAAARAPRALMALVAAGEHGWSLAVWEYGYGRLWPCEVRVVALEELAESDRDDGGEIQEEGEENG